MHGSRTLKSDVTNEKPFLSICCYRVVLGWSFLLLSKGLEPFLKASVTFWNEMKTQTLLYFSAHCLLGIIKPANQSVFHALTRLSTTQMIKEERNDSRWTHLQRHWLFVYLLFTYTHTHTTAIICQLLLKTLKWPHWRETTYFWNLKYKKKFLCMIVTCLSKLCLSHKDARQRV